ncbi:MAG: hypothetical protein AAB706_03955 [Patescibacteria group bacterium]
MNENNQNFLKQNTGSIILIVFAVIVFWGYTVFFKMTPLDSSRPVSAVGQKVVETLNRLNEVSLDGSFFATSEFQNLKEFDLIIPSQIVGRINPFAAIKK